MKIDEKQIHNEHRITFFIIKGCLILSSLIFFIAFITFLLPFEKAVLIANKLASDGYFESFTPLLYKQIQVPGLVLEGLIIIFFLTALFRFSQTRRIILNWQKWVSIFGGEFVHDWKKLFLNLKKYLNKNIVVSLVLLALLAFIIRLFLLWQPMDHDESYTSVIFAFEPLYRGLADYHFPNNHVFHTLLVHISYLIFGPQEWAVRLPAFSAGVLLAPLGFILAERWYGKQTAIFAGILIAMTPELIRYSGNARGYSLMAMFTILLFIAAHYVKRTKNYAAWSLMIIFGVLGFYTLPIMVYPLVILYSWLSLSWIIGDYSKNYLKTGFLWNIIISGFFTLILGLSLYIPIFRNWGFGSLFANPYVRAMPLDLYDQTVQSRLIDTWDMLNSGAVPYIGILLLTGVLLSLLFYRYIGKDKIPLQLTSVLSIVLLVAIQRPNIFSRTWHFYIPLICIWASAGLVTIFQKFVVPFPIIGKQRLSSVLFIFLGLIFTVNGLLYTLDKYPQSIKGSGDVEQATLFIENLLIKEDIVVITATDDANMWFYFEKYGLGRDYFSRSRPFENAYVVVTRTRNQTVDSVILERGPDLVFFDMESLKKIKSINSLDIYMINSNHDALNKAYGLQ